MRYWAPLLIAVLTAVMFMPHSSGAIAVLSFSDDVYYADVSPEGPDALRVNATLKNPYPTSTDFFLMAEIPSSPTWGIQLDSPVSVPSLDQKAIPIKIFIPRGELAFQESELKLVAVESQRGTSFQASCTIKVLPYLACSVQAVDDILIDMPLSGSYNVTLRNEGNTGANVSCSVDGSIPERYDLGPGRSTTVSVQYSVVEDTTFMLEPISGAVKGTPLTVNVKVEGDRAHILFDRPTALVAIPSGPNSVRVLPIGGSAIIRFATADDGTQVGIETVTVGKLQRKVLVLDPGREPIRRTVMVRINATMSGEEVESNPIPVLLLVKEKEETGYRLTPAIAGGIGGAAVVAVGTMGYLYAAVEGFRYKWLTMAFIPLYSIVHGDKVLDHFFRGRLYEYIKENPGVTFTALKKHFEVNNGNLTYHLHKLEREELIVSRAQGKFKLFYPDGIRLRDTEIVISLMDKDIMDMVTATPGIASQDVVSKLAGSRSKRTVSRHIKDLERKGLIEAYGEHRKLYISRKYDSAIVKDGLRLSLDINAGS